jgi:hypothetical protein
MKKLLLLTTLSLLTCQSLLAKPKTMFDEEYLELQINTASKEQQILKDNGGLQIDNKSDFSNIYLYSKMEMKPINSFMKFGFDFSYEDTTYDSKTLENTSKSYLSNYTFNLYTKFAIDKHKYYDLYVKTGFGYSSDTFEDIDNRIDNYTAGYQTFKIGLGIGGDIKLRKLTFSPSFEYSLNPFSDSIVFTDNVDTLEYEIDNAYGIKITLPLYFKISKNEEFGFQYIYSDNTLELKSYEPANDRDAILGYNTIYSKNNYFGFMYRIKF